MAFGPSVAATDCPDGTRVDLFVRGELEPAEISVFEAHLDRCDRCLGIVAEAAGAVVEDRLVDSAPGDSPVQARHDSVWVHLVAALARASERTPAAEPESGECPRFGPYSTTRLLGRGAMGVVYAGVHQQTGVHAAVKSVAPANSKSLAALRQEIAFLRTQRHPGIVQIFEDGIAEGKPWYAMELLEGRTLEDFNRALFVASGRAPVSARGDSVAMVPAARPAAAGGRLRDVLSIFARLCFPLSCIHRAGIVHCDLKPANVFVRHDGQPVLMDFGLLSRASGAIGRETLEVGGLRGTLPYLAPEVIRGGIPDARADLYAVGCMLYESITGHPPFLAPSAHALLEAHLYRRPEPPSHWMADVPGRVDEIIASLLAKAREKRIGDADVLQGALLSVFEGRPGKAPVPSRPYLFRPRLAGREAIVAEIQSLREDASRGRGRLVLVGGESGIGKTFLASECAHLAIRAGFEVVTGECVPLAATQASNQQLSSGAFAPFHNLLQRLADRCRGEEPERIAQVFGSARTARLLARYEPVVRHVVEGDGDDPPLLPPPAERERALDAMREVLERTAAARPLFFIIDDLQWADDLSLSLLESLSTSLPSGLRLLVLALYRTEETSASILRLRDKKHVHTIALQRLDDAALAAMVGDLLSQDPPSELLRALLQHSEGNPFFVAEYLRAAALEGRLTHTIAGWTLADPSTDARPELGELPLPSSLQELMERRLGLMSEGAQRAAETGAVLGREFSTSMLAALCNTVEPLNSEWIEEMVTRQIVERVDTDSLRFAHDKLRESAYARIEAGRKKRLHHTAGQAIERALLEDPAAAPRDAELAYHFLSGGVPRRAIEYFEKAAEQALRNSANADAVRFFTDAIETCTSNGLDVGNDRRARWERRIGDALQGLGDLSGSKRHLLAALFLMGQAQPAKGGMAVGIAEKLAKEIIKRVLPPRRLPSGSAEAIRALEAARAYDRLMQIYYYTGEYGPLFFANLATLDLAGRAPASATLAVAYTNAGAVAGIVPLPRVASAYFHLAERALTEAYDPEVDSYRTLLYAHYQSGLGKWAEAETAANRGLHLAEGLGFRRRWEDGAAVRSNLGWARDFEQCLTWGERMLESAQRRGDTQMVSWGLLRRAEVHAARGDLPGADASLTEAERIVVDLGRPEQIRALGLRAALCMHGGDARGAATAADRAMVLVAEAKTIHMYCLEPYARVAQVYLARSTSAADAKKKANTACRAMAAAARIFPIALPRACLLQGTRRWHEGDRRRARRWWERGLLAAAHLDLPYEGALLRRSLSCDESLPAVLRSQYLERAQRTLESLGVEPTDLRFGLVANLG